MVESLAPHNLSISAIAEKIQSMPKLGECFRAHYPDWKIVLRTPTWRINEDDYFREISHLGGGMELCSASVRTPRATFLRFQTELESLGDRSIGDAFLFVTPGVTRATLKAYVNSEGNWLRFSKFDVQGYPLEIHEYITEAGLQCLLA